MSNHVKEELMLQGFLCSNLTGWIVMHNFIQEINTNGIQSGYEGSRVNLTAMDRAEDPVL
jgi:hypothetical protein